MATVEIDNSGSNLVIGDGVEQKAPPPSQLQVNYPCDINSSASGQTQEMNSDRMSVGDFEVSCIIETLKSGSKRNIKRALKRFHGRVWNLKEEFLEQGGLAPLVEYIMHGRFYYSSEPIDILTALLTPHEECIKEFVEMGGVAWVVRLLKSKWGPLSTAALKICAVLCSTTEGRSQLQTCNGISALMRFIGKTPSTTMITAKLMSLLAEDPISRNEIVVRGGLGLLHHVDGSKDITLVATAAIADIIAVEETAQSIMGKLGVAKYIGIALSFPKEGELCGQATRLLAYAANSYWGATDITQGNGVPVLCGILDLGQTESEFWALSALETIFEAGPGSYNMMEPLESLLQVLLVGDRRCQQKAMCCLRLMAAKDSHSRQQIISREALPLLARVLGDEREHQKALQVVSLLIDDDEHKSRMKPIVQPLLKLVGSPDDPTQADAVCCLAKLSTNDSCATLIIAEGGVNSLLRVLRSGTPEAENWALKCLALLSHDDAFRPQIQDSDILVTLTEVLQNRPSRTKCIAAICIAKIFDAHPRMKRKFVSLGAIEALLELLHSQDSGLKGAVLLVLSKITCLQTCKAALSYDTKAIQAMQVLLIEGSDAVKECIAIILADIASVSTQGILMTGIQHPMLHLLDSKNPRIVENTLIAVQLIAEKHPPLASKLADDTIWKQLLRRIKDNHFRIRSMAIACVRTISERACAKMNAMPNREGYLQVVTSLLSAMKLSHVGCVTEAAAALAALAEANPPAIQSIAHSQKAIEHLVKRLKHKTGDWHEEAAHAVSVLIQEHSDNQLEFVTCGGVAPLTKIFNHGSLGSKRYCARIFGSLALNSSALTPTMRKACICSMIPVLTPGFDLLIDDACNEEVCRALANMACRNVEQNIIAREGGITKLIEQARNARPQAQEHAARALANLSCHDEASNKIGQEGGIEVLAKLLDSTNEKCRKQAIGGLANLMYKNPENADLLVKSDGMLSLIEMMSENESGLNEAAYRAVSNMAGSSAGKIYFSDKKIVSILVEKFLHPETPPAIHESIVRALSSLAVDNVDVQEMLLSSGLVAPLLKMLIVSTGSTRETIKKILTLLACGDDGLQDSHVPDLLDHDGDPQGIPIHLICPITHDIMQDPVIASDGHTYDRPAIQQWFQSKETSPLTNQALSDTRLVPNLLIVSILEDFVSKSGGWSKFIE